MDFFLESFCIGYTLILRRNFKGSKSCTAVTLSHRCFSQRCGKSFVIANQDT